MVCEMTPSEEQWLRHAYKNRNDQVMPGVRPCTGGGVEDCERLVQLGYLRRADLDYVITASGIDKVRGVST